MSHVSQVPSFLFETIPQVIDPLFFYAPSGILFLSAYYTNISGIVSCLLDSSKTGWFYTCCQWNFFDSVDDSFYTNYNADTK
jgi:hypothetical protein